MKNILVPTDFSENSINAIRYALNFFKESECTFYILHVVRISTLATPETSNVHTYKAVEVDYMVPAKQKLERLIKKIKPIGNARKHRFISLVGYDFFIDAVRDEVKDKNIDLIVMGTKGATGLKEVIIGSNAGDVITKVNCSALIVPENAVYESIREIVFPTDFSLFYNIKTLRPLLKILHDTGASIRILHISKSKTVLNPDQLKNKDLFKELFAECDCSFHFLTNRKVEDAVECFVESRDIDMIAMVAKNLNYFQQILFHSRVEKISYHTDIPFLVLHE
ncbi:MAG: universal stress protein [Flavobacteriaceae bacterium]|nr:universal stress protein [Flavobacteriaceae bacterium]